MVGGAWAVSKKTVDEATRLRLRDAAWGMLRDGTLQRLAREHLGDTIAAQYQFKEKP